MDTTELVQALGALGDARAITALLLGGAMLTKILTSRHFATLLISLIALLSRQKERQDLALKILQLPEGNATEHPPTDGNPTK